MSQETGRLWLKKAFYQYILETRNELLDYHQFSLLNTKFL